MPQLCYLQPGEPFPPTSAALSYPNGLLAAGGSLDSATLLDAYQRGIFPWYEAPQPVLWWSPDPRSVLVPSELRVSRSLRRTLRRSGFCLSADRAFGAVMRACAAPRAGSEGTWIDPQMERAYGELHRLGWAHSIEVWSAGGQGGSGDGEALVGGLYGVCLGRTFFGESMFSRVSDASKVAMVALVALLQTRGVDLIDCQVESEHLNSLGAKRVSRVDFESHLAHTVHSGLAAAPWKFSVTARALLAGLDQQALTADSDSRL